MKRGGARLPPRDKAALISNFLETFFLSGETDTVRHPPHYQLSHASL